MARATTSLPVPLSPVMRTVASVGATISISSVTFFMAGLLPMSSMLGEDLLQVFAQADHFAAGALVLQRIGDQVRELVGVDRLGDVVVGAELQRLHGGVDRRRSRS